MFSRLELENFGIFNHFVWDDHTKINILIGKNDTGKSHLLKVLYSLAKSLESYNKQSQPNALQETFSTILANKLICRDRSNYYFQGNARLCRVLHRTEKSEISLVKMVWLNREICSIFQLEARELFSR